MFPIVNCRITMAPRPFPRRIRGIDIVNAKAPNTPSMENVVSIISKYIILLISDMLLVLLRRRCSFSLAFLLNPSLIKNAEDQITAESASIGLILMLSETIATNITETTAKNHEPCFIKSFSL